MPGRKLHSGTRKTKESRLDWYGFLCLEVPLRYLRPFIIYAVPCYVTGSRKGPIRNWKNSQHIPWDLIKRVYYSPAKP